MILADYRCETHGAFEAFVESPLPDETACPRCGQPSQWMPVPLRFKVAIVASRGNHEKPQHKGWLDTSNLEEGQDYDEWRGDREAVHEELRKERVMQALRDER